MGTTEARMTAGLRADLIRAIAESASQDVDLGEKAAEDALAQLAALKDGDVIPVTGRYEHERELADGQVWHPLWMTIDFYYGWGFAARRFGLSE